MNNRDILAISWRMLQSNWLRSMLTVMGIGVAIATIVLLVGFGYGVQNLTIGSIVHSKSLLSLDVTTGASSDLKLDADAAEELRHLPGVADLSPVYVVEGTLTLSGKAVSTAIRSGTAAFLPMDGAEIQVGNDYTDSAHEIVLSPQVAKLFDLDPANAIGKKLTAEIVNPDAPSEPLKLTEPLTVVGVTVSQDSPAVYMPMSLLEPFDLLQPVMFKIMAVDRDSVVLVQQAVIAKGYQVDSLLNTLDDARRVFRYVTFGLVVIAVIALLVAAIGMFNTLTIALLERTREIGIMKAVGVTDSVVKKLFLTESVMIGFLGGLFGVGLGLGLSWLFGFMVNRLAAYYGTANVNIFQFSPWFLASMLIYPALLGLATGLYPSIRAARLNPLNALRYE